MEHFTDKLSQLAKHESYSHAAKKPQLTCKNLSEVIFDYEFTRLFKRLESKFVTLFILLLFFSSTSFFVHLDLQLCLFKFCVFLHFCFGNLL